MSGGWSGASVLLVQPYDKATGRPYDQCVAKLDPDAACVRAEKEATIAIRSDLGENAPMPFAYTEVPHTTEDGTTRMWGGLLLELCGAAWSLPGFTASGEAASVRTLKDIFREEAEAEEGFELQHA